MESFPSIKLQLVAGWEYACLSQKAVVEGYFLSYKVKLLKKLEIFFIPDPAINAQKNTNMADTCFHGFHPGPYFIEWHGNENVVALPTWCVCFVRQLLRYLLDE